MNLPSPVAAALVFLAAAGTGAVAVTTAPQLFAADPGPHVQTAAETPYNTQLFGITGPNGSRLYGPFRVDGTAYFLRHVDGERTVVHRGDSVTGSRADRVTALAAFYRVTHIDPLFYGPMAADTAFSRYRDFERRLVMNTTQGTVTRAERDGRRMLYRSLFADASMIPHDTLGNLTAVGRTTDRFTEEASWAAATDLTDAYRRLTTAYRSDLHDLVTVFNRTLERDADGEVRNQVYQYQLGASTDLDTVLAGFGTMARNADAMERAVDRRAAILAGDRAGTVPELPDRDRAPARIPDRLFDRGEAARLFAERSRGPDDTADAAHLPDGRETYGVRIACLNQTRRVQRVASRGSYPDGIVVDGVPRVVHYPGVEPGATDAPNEALDRYASLNGSLTAVPGTDAVAVTEADGAILFRDRRSNTTHRVERFIDRAGGNGIGRGVPVRWRSGEGDVYGVLGETDFAMTDCNCPYLERSRLQWNTVDAVHDRLAPDPVLGPMSDDTVVSLPTGLRDAVRDARRAEARFLDDPSTGTMERLGHAYDRLYRAAYRSRHDGVPPPLAGRLPRLRTMAALIDGRVGPMERTVGQYYDAIGPYGAWIFGELPDEVARPSRVADMFGPEIVLGYSLLGLVHGEGAPTWELEADVPSYSRMRYPPKRLVYTPSNR